MDLLKLMIANRAAGPVSDPKPRKARGRKEPTKTEKAKEHVPGSRAMRKYICEEKPPKKVVKEHLEAILAEECASSSDED